MRLLGHLSPEIDVRTGLRPNQNGAVKLVPVAVKTRRELTKTPQFRAEEIVLHRRMLPGGSSPVQNGVVPAFLLYLPFRSSRTAKKKQKPVFENGFLPHRLSVAGCGSWGTFVCNRPNQNGAVNPLFIL